MGQPVWEEPACGARFRAAEGGGEERPAAAGCPSALTHQIVLVHNRYFWRPCIFF
jgi:hypothetical protein